MSLLLAPLRGVTIRTFRRIYLRRLLDGGFTEAITPFIPANPGCDPLKDRELRPDGDETGALPITPQFIGKDPAALAAALRRVRAAGYETADLNAGCPYPMIRKKGRGSGLLRTPDVLLRLLETGCAVMGPGRFSLKIRLGLERPDELLTLLPAINAFPLRFLTVHARTARQMYEGACDTSAFDAVARAARVPVVFNGDVPFPPPPDSPYSLMVGRAFIRHLGREAEASAHLLRYLDASCAELHGERPVLGRLKELIAYWKDEPPWRRRWPAVKIARSVDELRLILR